MAAATSRRAIAAPNPAEAPVDQRRACRRSSAGYVPLTPAPRARGLRRYLKFMSDCRAAAAARAARQGFDAAV